MHPGPLDEPGQQVGPVYDSIGFAEAALEFDAETDFLQQPSAMTVANEDGGRCEGARGEGIPDVQIFERSHRIGADLEAGADSFESLRLFEYMAGAAISHEAEGAGHACDTAAGDENGMSGHGKPLSLIGHVNPALIP